MDREITIDLSRSRKDAELVRDTLIHLRFQHPLQRYEYTKTVRIAPGEIPYSHPVLTLNTRVQSAEPLLCLYLHEQMHWYTTWYSFAHAHGWNAIWEHLELTYPDAPTGFPKGSPTRASSYLHLIVNWLEVETASELIGRSSATKIASENFVYSGIYEIVLRDWDKLRELYREHDLIPLRPAEEMSDGDLMLAARYDEAERC